MATAQTNAPSIDKGRTFKDFTAGMENVPDISAIAENALSEIVNMELDASGALVSRPPVVLAADSIGAGDPMEFLGWYNRADGTSLMVLSTPSGTWLYNVSLQIFTLMNAIVGSGIAQYQNRLYIVSRTAAGGWWGEVTPGSGTYSYQSLAGGVKPMPKGDQIALYKDRLWIAGWGNSDERTKIYLSEVTNTTGGDINNWPPLNFFYVGRGDGQWITRLHPGPNDLTIFRNNSSYYFSYDADPTLGQLNKYEGNVGCDNKYSLASYQNYVYVVNNGALYQLISYQFYRRNDPAKFEFVPKTSPSPWSVKSALSVLGSRMIVWYSGGIYVYNVTTNSWSEWESENYPARFITIQRPENYYGDDIAYGITGHYDSAKFGIYRITDGFNFVDTENMVCRVVTKAYDYQTPDRFKTLYWWLADVLISSSITGTAVPINLTAYTTTWDDMDAAPGGWDQLSLGSWDHPLVKVPGVVTSQTIPSGTPSRVSVKFRKKMRFRRVFYELSMPNDGSAAKAPVHLFSIVTYMTDKSKVSRGVT